MNRFFAHVEGYPQIAQVLKEPDQTKNIGGGWHTDHTYDTEPAMGSMLHAIETPPHGGDTMYASTCRAYDTLSDGFKKTLEGLNALHSSRHVFGPQARYVQKGEDTAGRLGNNEAATQDSTHPLVITHPISGKKSIYVNPGFTIGIEGWSDAEAEPFLKILYDHIAKPEHTYRFQWAPGSLAFWDNRATWHYAVNDYHGERRLMHRITIEGDRSRPRSYQTVGRIANSSARKIISTVSPSSANGISIPSTEMYGFSECAILPTVRIAVLDKMISSKRAAIRR